MGVVYIVMNISVSTDIIIDLQRFTSYHGDDGGKAVPPWGF